MRVLVDPPRPGPENMARDLAILAEGVPTIRLYGWRPACVSLGYPQPETDIDLEAARELGVDVTRRPTGGGAILHAEDEVTYSVVLPRNLAPAGLFDSYRFIARGVVNALAHFGLKGDWMEGHTGRDPLCYLREEGVSVGVGGRKISGGAQRRTKTHLLQHGTLLVSSDLERNARLFRLEPGRVAAHITSLRDHGLSPTRAEVTRALAQGFVRALRPVLEGEAALAAKA
jgi:lipoate---protein ligase